MGGPPNFQQTIHPKQRPFPRRSEQIAIQDLARAEAAERRVKELEHEVEVLRDIEQMAKGAISLGAERTLERDRQRQAIREFLTTIMTIRLKNEPEWMDYLAERFNEVCEVIGEEDRVEQGRDGLRVIRNQSR